MALNPTLLSGVGTEPLKGIARSESLRIPANLKTVHKAASAARPPRRAARPWSGATTRRNGENRYAGLITANNPRPRPIAAKPPRNSLRLAVWPRPMLAIPPQSPARTPPSAVRFPSTSCDCGSTPRSIKTIDPQVANAPPSPAVSMPIATHVYVGMSTSPVERSLIRNRAATVVCWMTPPAAAARDEDDLAICASGKKVANAPLATACGSAVDRASVSWHTRRCSRPVCGRLRGSRHGPRCSGCSS